MESVVFFNNKGGVGKTTLLCNVASFLSIKRNKKMLVVDADPQCNSTTYCLKELDVIKLYDNKDGSTIDKFIDPIRKGRGYLNDIVDPIRSKRFHFDIIPGDPRLSLFEDLLASDWKTAVSGDPRGLQTTFVFKEMLQKYNKYDYIFLMLVHLLGLLIGRYCWHVIIL